MLYFAEDAHAQAGAGEGMAVHHVGRQSELDAEFAHFVFKQFAQWFKELEGATSRAGPPTLWCDLIVCAFLVLAPADSITSG